MKPVSARLLMSALCVLAVTAACSHKGKTTTTTTTTTYKGLGKDSVTSEVLKKFEPPAVDPKLKDKITRMLDMQSPGMGIIDSNTGRLFFSWKVTGITQVWRIDGPLKFPIQMTTGTDPVGINQITPDGKFLVLGIDKDGQENPGIFIQSTEGGPVEKLFQKEKVQARFQFMSPDGKFIFFAANDVKPDEYVIYRMELSSRKIETIFNQPGLWSVGDYDWNKQLLLLEKATGSASSEWVVYDMKAKTVKPIIGQGEREEYSLSFGNSSNEFIINTNKYSDFRRLYRYSEISSSTAIPTGASGDASFPDKVGKGFTAITPEMKADVDGFQMNRPHTRLLYTVNDNGFTRFYALDARNGYKAIALPKFPKAEHMYPGATSWDDKYTMIGVSTAQAPRLSYSYNWSTQKLTQWTLPSAPEVKLSQFVPAKAEFYTARDGTKIPMLVRRSPFCSTKPCPVIVHFHGGPEAQSTPGFSPWAQLFVEAGFTFVEPNVRGSDGYGKKWLDSDNAAKRLDVISDIEDASIFIRKNFAEDGKAPKVGVMGGSYGGYSTLFAMTYYAGAYDAGVAEVGMSNLLTFLNNTAPYRRSLRTSEYGDPEKDKDALIKLSPMTYLEKIKSPLMIVQGANDPRVPVGEAIQFKNALDKKGIASELIIFADEGHGSQKRSNQIIDIAATIGFFQKHLR
ncbi:MAG: prolyl oligopeptidase family serine peptidase [Bdellovibrionota bacterium]